MRRFVHRAIGIGVPSFGGLVTGTAALGGENVRAAIWGVVTSIWHDPLSLTLCVAVLLGLLVLWVWTGHTSDNQGGLSITVSSNGNQAPAIGAIHGNPVFNYAPPVPVPPSSSYSLANMEGLDKVLTDAAKKHSDGMRTFEDPLTVRKKLVATSEATASIGIVVNRAPTHDVSLTEAALYAVTGKWGMIGGKEHFATYTERENVGNQVADWLSDFEQKASDGSIRAWGRPQENQSGPIVGIDALHWRTHEAFPISVALGEPQSRQRLSMSREGGFNDLRVSRAEFEREWPHA